MRPFKSDLIIDEPICEADLRVYHIGFDGNKFRLQPLVDVIRSVIPEFSLGYHCGSNIPMTDIVERLKEAAETVYLTENIKQGVSLGN